MQGKSNDTSDGLSHSNLKEALRESELEDQELINKFIVRNDKHKTQRKPLGNGVIIAIATIALLLAFVGGIGFGVFNFDFNANTMSLFGQASISDSAFPVVVPNVTQNVTNYTSSNTDYNYTDLNYTDTSSDEQEHTHSDDQGSDSSSGGSASESQHSSSSRSSSRGPSNLMFIIGMRFLNFYTLI
ncbi:MAG: hypothetical protein IJH34_05590 [Romboutsia sp.]|nr:hypothetical protein [Romboutsia sp.]